jgi:hypothetical protein
LNEGEHEVTQAHAPTGQTYELTDRDGDVVVFLGRHLGEGSSFLEGKERWFEVDLYKTHDATFIVHTRGLSTVPGERTRIRIVETTSAFEVVELLTVNHGGKIYLPRQSARALSQAAQWDDDIRDAYVNRAV